MAKFLIKGTAELLDGGIVRMHDASDRTFVEVREADIVGREQLADDKSTHARWLIAVPTSANVTDGELSAQEWTQLFDVPQTPRLAAVGSVRESWCRCTSEGVSHGVCCP